MIIVQTIVPCLESMISKTSWSNIYPVPRSVESFIILLVVPCLLRLFCQERLSVPETMFIYPLQPYAVTYEPSSRNKLNFSN